MPVPVPSTETRRDEPEPEWTPRQREVLDLLVRGRTNGQIADDLGISLGGAKWHVSEIITKLGVDSREEAAEYWRAHNGLRLRFTRALRSLLPGAGWAKIAIAGGGAVAAGLVAVLAVSQLSGGSGCASGNVQYVETSPALVSPTVTLSLSDALQRASAAVGFTVAAPCKLPGPNLVIQGVSVTHPPQSLGSYAELSIIPADTPRENGHFMNPSPWIKIQEQTSDPEIADSQSIGTIAGNEVRYFAHEERSGVVVIVPIGAPTPTPAATDIPDSDLALYSVRGPHAWLVVQASGAPGALPPQSEVLTMLESMFD